MAHLHRRAHDTIRRQIPAAIALALWLAAPAARADEIYRWTDENGKVHFGNRQPAGSAQNVEATHGGIVNQTGGGAAVSDTTAADAPQVGGKPVEDREERLKRLRSQQKWAEREASIANKPVVVLGEKPKTDPMKDEAYCQKTYGKSCDELAHWREKAVDDCQRINSIHCDDPGYIDAKQPKTIEQKKAIHEENRSRAAGRERQRLDKLGL